MRFSSRIPRPLCIVAAAAVLLLAVAGVSAQTDWYTYPVRSMAELIAITPPTGNPDLIVSANPFPSKTVITYLGKKRTIEGHARRFIDLWGETRNISPENKTWLVEEYLFKEKDREFWMPMVKKISPVVDKELKAGDEILAYYFFMGGYNPKTLYDKDTTKNKPPFTGKDQIEWVFVFEEFEKPAPNLEEQARALKGIYLTRPFIGAIDKKLERAVAGRAGTLIDPRQIKSKSSVIFTGKTRPTGQSRLDFVDDWGKGLGMISLSNLFKEEALFRMDEKEYWLPVRMTTLENMRASLKEGDSIVISTLLAGGISDGESFDWVFVVGEFSVK
jgi:hypothetical protein